MTTTLPTDFALAVGAHDSFEDGACLLEAVSFIAGEPFSDRPKCASRYLTNFGQRLNDGSAARVGDSFG